ncbi:MAG TPA: DUF1906 domain-containing protein [Solirubrobacteraceae bacterium]|nr:DUF1906 domain-containing protein [Solirubrobacteraceae bacterium]
MPVLTRGRPSPLGPLAALLLMALVLCPTASAHATLRRVNFRGVTLTVPTTWPVFHLGPDSRVCVRFNRHAVYLGDPGAAPSCPVQATGRTEAILVQPGAHALAGLAGGHVGVLTRHGLTVVATWGSRPRLIRRALGVRRLPRAPRPRPVTLTPVSRRPALRRSLARHTVSSTAPATPGQVYAGEGFDACATPSASAMASWAGSSPYGAVGIYIGGENMACAQPNLTPDWVSTESAAGWHLVPIYVGLQAPGNACGCAALSPAQAANQGATDAATAVADAEAVGIGPGNPVYFDMEGYTRSTATSDAVLAFLQAWTTQLHAQGFLSGVYSSDASGIADLVSRYGSGYVEPDELWFAAWNGSASTQDGTIPASDWANDQRLHQFQGGVDETYGGVRMNVDNDALGAATAAYGTTTATTPPAPPVAAAPPALTGTPVVGQTLSETHGSWSNAPTSYSVQWERCSTTGAACSPIPGADAGAYTLTAADAGHAVRVAEAAANGVGSGTPAASAPSPAVAVSPFGFWALTAAGDVLPSEYQVPFGVPAPNGLNDWVGMAATRGRHGYWLATRYGRVAGFGNAASAPAIRAAHPITAIVRAARAGYWLLTGAGNVYAGPGAPFLGSLAARHLSDVAGMAALPNAPGYWLVQRTGAVSAFGRAPVRRAIRPAHPIIGIVAAPDHSYWLFTADGNVYNASGAPFYGSAARSGLHDIVAMLATPDGHGYWLVARTGQVLAYGDAPALPALSAAQGPLLALGG